MSNEQIQSLINCKSQFAQAYRYQCCPKERLIQLSDGPNDGLLKSISSSQKADMLLGDSLAGISAAARV